MDETTTTTTTTPTLSDLMQRGLDAGVVPSRSKYLAPRYVDGERTNEYQACALGMAFVGAFDGDAKTAEDSFPWRGPATIQSVIKERTGLDLAAIARPPFLAHLGYSQTGLVYAVEELWQDTEITLPALIARLREAGL